MASFNTPVSSRPPLASTKKAILDFIKGLVSKSLSRAFEILLSPCCKPIASAVAVCDNKGTYTVTVTTSSPINLEGNGVATLTGSGGGSTTIYPLTDGQTTFVFSGVDSASGNHKISLSFIILITKDIDVNSPGGLLTAGYFYPGISVDFPVCVS